jgi:hypothetical protein
MAKRAPRLALAPTPAAERGRGAGMSDRSGKSEWDGWPIAAGRRCYIMKSPVSQASCNLR